MKEMRRKKLGTGERYNKGGVAKAKTKTGSHGTGTLTKKHRGQVNNNINKRTGGRQNLTKSQTLHV